MRIPFPWPSVGKAWMLRARQPNPVASWAKFIRPDEKLRVLRTRRPDVIKICHAKENFALWSEVAELWLFMELKMGAPVVALRCEVYLFIGRTRSGPMPWRPFTARDLTVRLSLREGTVHIGQLEFLIVPQT